MRPQRPGRSQGWHDSVGWLKRKANSLMTSPQWSVTWTVATHLRLQHVLPRHPPHGDRLKAVTGSPCQCCQDVAVTVTLRWSQLQCLLAATFLQGLATASDHQQWMPSVMVAGYWERPLTVRHFRLDVRHAVQGEAEAAIAEAAASTACCMLHVACCVLHAWASKHPASTRQQQRATFLTFSSSWKRVVW